MGTPIGLDSHNEDVQRPPLPLVATSSAKIRQSTVAHPPNGCSPHSLLSSNFFGSTSDLLKPYVSRPQVGSLEAQEFRFLLFLILSPDLISCIAHVGLDD
jgi:hypothetical protein